MNIHNPVVKLCLEGTQAEFQGKIEEARRLYQATWTAARDDYEMCVAAHYVARHQEEPQDRLRWNREALVRADLVGDERVASFYPSLEIRGAVGYQAFDALRLLTTPASLFYNAAADITAPLLNRQVLKANYLTANAKQQQAVFNYGRAILKGYTEAANQLAMIENLEKSYQLRSQEVDRLNESIDISSGLFK